MRYTWIDEYLLAKKGVEKDLQPDWNWVRYKVGGKMFAAILLDGDNKPYYINLKLEPMEGEFLRRQYEDILPGYYSNKAHWNSVRPDGAVPDELLREMLDKSYQLVLKGLTKKMQKEILGGERPGVDSRCGLECSKYDCKKEFGFDCKGCANIPDAPWGHCPVKSCCEGKNLVHCGECPDFPCELLNSFAYDKEHGEGDGSRLEVCRRWAGRPTKS